MAFVFELTQPSLSVYCPSEASRSYYTTFNMFVCVCLCPHSNQGRRRGTEISFSFDAFNQRKVSLNVFPSHADLHGSGGSPQDPPGGNAGVVSLFNPHFFNVCTFL